MRKISWPWIGSTPNEMGSMGPKNEGKDKIEDSQERHDTLVTEKSVLEDPAPSMTYENGIMSPVADVSFAKDKEKKQVSKSASVEIYNNEDLITIFSCNIASSFQDKVSGLQPYNELKETAGLIFEYQRPEDVLYHMGTVKFSIDILFIDQQSKIKKLYKDIQPGTLGTFGCAGVKHVLEICGGLSDRLGIRVGDVIKISKNNNSITNQFNKVSKEMGIKKEIIIKYSFLGRNGFSNWKGFPILNVNEGLIKTASRTNLITDLVSNFNSRDDRKIIVFDFDGLIEASPIIKVYKTKKIISEEQTPYIKINGHITGIENSSRDVNFNKLASMMSNETVLLSNKSFESFLSNSKDYLKLSSQLREYSNCPDYKVVVATRYDFNYFQPILEAKLKLQFGEPIKIEVVQLQQEADASDIIDRVNKIYKNNQIKIYSDDSILKRAGTPIPDDVKNKAKRAYRLLDLASEVAETSVENMKTNLSEYEKIKDNPDSIGRSKGQYNQSIKRNTRVIRDLLIRIRDAIKIFNEIKDVSTTMEIIDGLTSAAKITSDTAEDIFDLIDQIDAPDFHILLKEKVDAYERIVEDLQSSLDRGKNYVNSNILGLKVLSD